MVDDDIYVDTVLQEVEQKMQQLIAATSEKPKEYTPVRGRVVFSYRVVCDLFFALCEHLQVRNMKEGMSRLLDVDGQQIHALSSLLSVDIRHDIGSVFDRQLSREGQKLDNHTLIDTGKIAMYIGDTKSIQKYAMDPDKVVTTYPVYHVHLSEQVDLDQEAVDIRVEYLSATHSINSQTLDMNLTGGGYIYKD